MHPGVGGGIHPWGWRWDPALELELAASLGWAPFQACALLNIFIILNSLFPPCILLAPALGRDGDPANGSDPWEHHPGLGEGGCDTCGNHRRFRCVYEPGHNFLCLGFPARPRALHGHPGRAVGGGVQHPWVTTPAMTGVAVLLGQGRGGFGEVDCSSSRPSPHPGMCVGWEAGLSPRGDALVERVSGAGHGSHSHPQEKLGQKLFLEKRRVSSFPSSSQARGGEVMEHWARRRTCLRLGVIPSPGLQPVLAGAGGGVSGPQLPLQPHFPPGQATTS